MNDRQLIVIILGGIILIGIIIYPPWKMSMGFYSKPLNDGSTRLVEQATRKYSFIWKAPKPKPGDESEWGISKPRIDISGLELEAIPVIAFALLFYFTFRTKLP